MFISTLALGTVLKVFALAVSRSGAGLFRKDPYSKSIILDL